MADTPIFHYTTVESLALILKTRRLRFTRLDGVDDLREAQSHVGINFGRYFFVSCWTKDDKESIPLWNMYGQGMAGVRLQLPQYPFNHLPLEPDPNRPEIECVGTPSISAPLRLHEIFGETYLVATQFQNLENFAGPVQYVPNVEDQYKQSITREVTEDGKVYVSIEDVFSLPRYKSVEWQFQSEYRFCLYVLPIPPQMHANESYGERCGRVNQAFLNGIDPGINYFDIELSPEALDRLTVRTGPLCSPGTRVCIESLLASFAPNASIEVSSLAGNMRGGK